MGRGICRSLALAKRQNPQCHALALRISGALNVVLLLAVIALSVFALLSPCLTENGSGAQPCPMNWLLKKGKCYYISRDTERSWSRSREDCAERDSQLLVIQDQEEKDILEVLSKC
ncbi:killer cell lectin-like receptor subfamily B member 1A [Rhinatrema bivittatum]|uniref:killer cell lectin-like receptor subfamily B member 1A n=1 Tax=Rhinatrema bivittatum TaxID=194408 RepID=UPI0011275097|nr:killer cell lectin-like receptor subfamily B member 1A [Rhinatrema bivittatum]